MGRHKKIKKFFGKVLHNSKFLPTFASAKHKNTTMKKYNYFESICEDIRNYIGENGISPANYADKDDMFNSLNDLLWVEDSVTGNASGSYTCNTFVAEENLCHNLDLLGQAVEEFGCSPEDFFTNGPEWADVTIRCYLLSQCLTAVLSEDFPFFWDED